ncbi:unannotated protein [freshwater metagenome]|uniref:Unannotated protein n=1 Tax=freshwater metagenome TaxID=449393 RepID=A0A6J7D2Q2_9ZZZZ|nr:acyl-CoA dehydrogenase [Actinomycetota bacterium]
MDFRLSTEQDEIRELTNRILTDQVTNESQKAAAASEHGLDMALWRTLADAGIVGIGMPESVGGGGLGALEIAVVLEEVGRATAPVPAYAVMIAGVALGHFGALDQLEGVAGGERIVTIALQEAVGSPYEPSSTVTGGLLSGEKICVPAGTAASAFVVSATDGLYVVAADAVGVTIERQNTTSGIPDARVTFSNSPATKLADAAGCAWLLDVATTAQCLLMSGVCQRALALTAAYAKERVQFERAIATFQAVSQRAGDSYINTEAVRLTAWQAAWRLSEGLPASAQVASAKFWASDGGLQVLHAAQHLHGGVGVDRDYPLHRCFLWGKQIELTMGSTMPSLVRLGRMLADTPVS